MNFGSLSNHYDLLEVSRNASNREIHEAYLRIKAAYANESLALYSLVSPEERDQTMRELETAYAVLSDESRRRDYDFALDGASSPPHPSSNASDIDDPFALPHDLVSIDRVPPMDSFASEALLIPPALGTGSIYSAHPESKAHEIPPHRQERPIHPNAGETELKQLIAQEIEWKGALLRKIREVRGVSVEDLCAQTKLSKSYLHAIENEEFTKLPAPVFVRGFVVQICKALKLPHDRAAAAYMARCYQARKEA